MKVLVTGASGFVGGYVCRRLVVDGHEVRGLSRAAHPALPAGVVGVRGDVVTGAGLQEAMAGVAAVVHLVGIIRERRQATFERVHVEGTRNVLAAHRAGPQRLVHMSALGAAANSASRYQRTKAAAEALVRASGSDWTILRPSLIFGVGDGFFGGTLRDLVTRPPLVPVVGRGEFPFRPVWAEDVATAVSRVLARPATLTRSFDLVGPREYSLRRLLLLVRSALSSRKPLVNVPLPLMRLAVAMFQLLPEPRITREEFVMLLAGNTGDPGPAVEALGLRLGALEDHLAEVLHRPTTRT